MAMSLVHVSELSREDLVAGVGVTGSLVPGSQGRDWLWDSRMKDFLECASSARALGCIREN